MRTTALVSAIGLALYAAPALAEDGPRPFIELSAGSSWANKMGLTVGTTPNPTTNGISLTHKTGYDVAVSAGLDFGLLRAEVELSQRAAHLNKVATTVPIPIRSIAGSTTPILSQGSFTAYSGITRARAAMLNGYAQLGDSNQTTFFAGAGLGYAQLAARRYAIASGVHFLNDRDSGLAWQLLAGVREPLSDRVSIGVKYRYFRTKSFALTDVRDRSITGRSSFQNVQATLSYAF
jgi:opacity protein-like surface antigen